MQEYNDTNFAEAIVKRQLIEDIGPENPLSVKEMDWALAVSVYGVPNGLDILPVIDTDEFKD